MSSTNADVGKVFNIMSGSGGGDGPVRLEGIAVTKQPLKTTYKSGEAFETTGMVVTATYAFGLTSDVTGYTVSPQVLTDGVSEVTITYTEGRITKTTSVAVTVEKVLTGIEVTTPPQKTNYNYLEKFDPYGMVVTAKFSDGSSSAAVGYTYPTTEFTTLGSQPINISYTYEDVTKDTSLSVTVNAISVPIPTQKEIPAYTGQEQTPVWNNYDSVKMAISGETSGLNAKDNYSVTFTLNYGYVFPDGQNEATVKWAISRAIIEALPKQVDVPAADGGVKTPSWEGYDPEKMTIGGDRSGTVAGDYSASFTPTANYQWWDHTTGPKTVVWKIASIIVSVPTQKNIPTYDGSPKTPEWDNFDTDHSTVQVTSATDAGEHNATFTLLEGMWEDGGTEPKVIKWRINRASISAVPQQSGSLVYDGNPKTPTWDNNYDTKKMTVSVESKVNAGTDYPASFTPTANYQWWDGSIDAKTATWAIGKASYTPTANPASVTLNTSAKSASFIVSRKEDGVISATSNDTKVAMVGTITQASGQVVVNSVNDTTGTAVITVKIAETANYKAAELTVNVTAQFVTIYGVEWDWTSSGPTKGTRTDGAAGFGDPNPAVNNGNGSSPFDNLMPWAGMVKETRTGGVMVKEPKYWFKWTKTGKKLKLQIADGPVDGFHVDPVNMDRGDGLGELDFSYIARYHCATSTYKSETNKAQQVSITRSAARTSIHNLGANIWQMDFAQMWYVGMLFLVEFADWNGERIGRGCSASGSKENNGKTDAMQYHTGTTAANRDTYGYTQYRNIEGWWDNVFDWMDGCYYTSSGLNVILDPNKFSDNANGTLIGSMPSSGYPNDMALPTQSGFEWALRPASTGGSTSTYVPDNWGFYGSNPCLRHGGNYGQYQGYGPFCVDYNGTSDTGGSFGCRLQERPPKAA